MYSHSAADLARLFNLTRARISQLVREGRLEGAYSGEGRGRRFDPQLAAEKLERALDMGQALGNGAASAEARRQILQGAVPSGAAEAETDDAIDNARYRRARADRAEVLAIKERLALAAEEGRYVLADEVELSTRRAIAAEVAEFESVLRSAAAAIAAEHGLDARAIKARLFAQWRAHRARRAKAAAETAAAAGPSAAEAAEMQVA